jgi:hypothetical protein
MIREKDSLDENCVNLSFMVKFVGKPFPEGNI